MSPTVLRIGSFRFFFNSREETRCHVHVATPNGVAKFWLEPTIALESFHDLSSRELRDIDTIVRENHDAFKKAWKKHFNL